MGLPKGLSKAFGRSLEVKKSGAYIIQKLKKTEMKRSEWSMLSIVFEENIFRPELK